MRSIVAKAAGKASLMLYLIDNGTANTLPAQDGQTAGPKSRFQNRSSRHKKRLQILFSLSLVTSAATGF